MKTISLTTAEVVMLNTLLGLDLEAIGLSPSQRQRAIAVKRKLSEDIEAAADKAYLETPASRPRPLPVHDPLRALRLTPTFRHQDK